jgi:two-component system cell cycle sensor histidine kinase/response regulator CckA
MKSHRDERDITNSLAFYRKIFYESKIGMSVYDASGQCIEANEAIGRLIGANREKVLMQNYYHLESWKKFDLLETALCAIKENTDKHREVSVTSTFGRHITMDYHMTPFMVADQEYLLLIASDVTVQKEAEEGLRESESKFRNLFDLSPQAIALTEIKSGKLVDVNHKFCELTKYSKKEILGLKTTEVGFYREADRSKFLTELQASGRVDGLEMDFKAKDNSVLNALMFGRIIQIAGVPFILTIFHDITEQKLLKSQLRRAEKMEAIGTLAGGVAHDLNNILSGIVGYPDLLLMQIPDDSPLRTFILNIQDSGKRAAVIVHDLLTLARRGVDITEVVNLKDIILEYLKSPEHKKLKLYHPGVEIETNIESDLLNISGSSVHLSKIVLNLVSNAAEAMPDGGKIFISAENRYLDRPISGYDSVEEGDYVTLMVSDNGIGISKKDLERIFEPFYTKKVMGRSGTGLGMAVIWGTVKDHKGYIDVQSTEGKGSTFTIYFPAKLEKITREECMLAVEDYMGKGESILVIDDVKGQRELAINMLTALGYSTHAVSSGKEAVEYLKEHSADLIVLDMIMDPGMDGLDTYKKIIKSHPRQKAIIVSGYSETDRVKKAQKLGAGAYVKKPYTLEKVGIAVRDEMNK